MFYLRIIMEQENGELVIIISTILVSLITLALIALFVVFQKRKNKLLLDQEEEKKRFEKEIAETQIEIREETLRNISWELHDNIGQLLTLAKIQLQNTSSESITEVKETIGKSLREIRTLSKLINPEFIKNIKLKNAIQLEVERFNRLNFIGSSFVIVGDEKEFDEKSEIIIFRILQEFLSNTIKHSKASTLKVYLEYQKEGIKIKAKDNGIGFNLKNLSHKGIGLQNMKSRAKLINATINLESEIEKGTTLTIQYYA